MFEQLLPLFKFTKSIHLNECHDIPDMSFVVWDVWAMRRTTLK